MTISAHLLSPMHPITAQQCNQCSSSDILLCAACAVVPPGYFTFGTGAAAQLRVCAQGSYAAGWVPIRTKCTSCGTNVRTDPQDPNEHMDSPALVATSSASCSECLGQTWGALVVRGGMRLIAVHPSTQQPTVSTSCTMYHL